ncbi:hypothetical protein BH708_10410 [Brachybacterium sp. P6-10-X1]|uniref:hypothetical protein n=1 Tax=Brachybacterium sp. P6-10-X1 TaxID=1903186 RepID=UPI000971AB6B|nr:hypothetical protein [Brachybacterium sp. P6-10-X1]APX33053.1 hypothetical protein BH708_10410 [Brachybacterium sp. P6-10-X1]
MPPRAAALRARARTAARDALYSPPSRALARALAHDRRADRVRTALEDRGHGPLLRRLASEPLPRGMFYLRLTITNGRKFDGQVFRLFQGDRVVYGDKISAPPAGQHLEYSNIIVTSDDPSDFTVDLPVKHRIHVGRGAFTTEEQDSYDQRYQVEQHGDVRYSLRGNTVDPSRILITFPGFPPATSRVSYAVSYLKALSAADLADTLMVCFQDRYGVDGTYMLFDNAGRPLHDRVTAAITDLLRTHGLDPQDVLLFGASKGASIAAMIARDLPGARQVLVVPQMNLPYYFSKPVLRDGLYRDRRVWDIEQPSALLRRYLAEGRRIDWFYSDADQGSNYSLVEYACDAPGLTKHRIDAPHAKVAKKSLPTVLTLLRAFAAGADEDEAPQPLTCRALEAAVHEDGVEFTAHLEGVAELKDAANVYLEGTLGATRFRQLLTTSEEDPAVRTTTVKQRLDPALHPVDALTRVVAFDGTARTWSGPVPEVTTGVGAPAPAAAEPIPMPQELTCHATAPRAYAVLGASNRPSTQVRYVSAMIDSQAATAELVVVPSDRLPQEPAVSGEGVRARFVMAALDGWRDVDLLARRAALTARVDAIRVVIEDPDVADAQLRAVRTLYGIDVTVTDHRAEETTA